MQENERIKILIADDEYSIRKVLGRRLEAAGYECIGASNGEEAVSMAREHQPVLILLDLMMPVMDGYHAYQQLQQIPQTRSIKTIFFTAQDPKYILKQGIDVVDSLDFIFKPFDSKAVQLLIGEIIAKQGVAKN